MNLASLSLVQSSYFFLFIFSIIVLFDVLIRFKSPIKLKTFFLIFVFALLVGSFCLFIRTVPDRYILIRMICPMLIGTSMVQIFTNLYFIQNRRVTNIYLISAYAIYIYLIIYVQIVGYETVFPKYNSINSSASQVAKSINLPMYLDLFLEVDFIFFNLFCLYYIYNILFNFHTRIFTLNKYNFGHFVFSWSYLPK